jgi:hypothetical protein
MQHVRNNSLHTTVILLYNHVPVAVMGLVSCSDDDDDEARQVIYWLCAPGLRATSVQFGGGHGDCSETAVLT